MVASTWGSDWDELYWNELYCAGEPMTTPLALLGGTPVRSRPFFPWPIFDATDEQRVVAAVRSGKWGRLDGEEVDQFEQRFAQMHGCKHGIAVVNGTVSLRLALLAAGLQAEDEVIVPPYTFYATASAVVEANMIPVFADIDLDSFNLCPRAVRAAITDRTRAIIPVHFAGQPAEMDVFNQIAREHRLLVLEDAAHAHGARWRNQVAGSLGRIASFSFQSSKNLASGEGGIITTNDDALADKCRSLHNCGRIPTGVWYEHHTISANYRLSELQGALLNSQLERLDQQTEIRDANGRYLAERLRQLPGVYPQKIPPQCTRHSFHLFMMRLDGIAFGAPRASVIAALHAEGIPCSAGYGYSLNHQPLFRNKAFGPYLHQARERLDYERVECPNSDLICSEQAIWLGQSMFLGSREDMDDINRAFEKIFLNRHQLAKWSVSSS
jgi:dTDP-4-amino-4,6-dideoxygalactose transaminase